MPATRTITHSTTRWVKSKGKSTPVASFLDSGSQQTGKARVERVYTDAILAIKPIFIDLIAARKKNYEYRPYKLRKTVVRIWLYASAPHSAITHVMLTTLSKTPGQVCDPTGLGNDDFDNGTRNFDAYKFGYPVLGLYRLKNVIKIDAMRGYGVSPPQGLVYATKKLVDDIPLKEMEKLF